MTCCRLGRLGENYNHLRQQYHFDSTLKDLFNPLKASVLCIGHVVVLELWTELNVCVQLSSRCLHGVIQLSVSLTNNRFYLHMKVAIAHVCGAKS